MVMVVCQFDFKFQLPRTFIKLPKMAVAMLLVVLLAAAHAAKRKCIVSPRRRMLRVCLSATAF